ncbi:MAG: hypothetical protein RLZZ420_2401 [Bacteroidota bacterium]
MRSIKLLPLISFSFVLLTYSVFGNNFSIDRMEGLRFSTPPATITQRGNTTTGAAQNRNLSISKPVGAVTGDILIVNIAYLRNNATATNPILAGWTLINAAWLTDTDKETIRGAVLYRIVTAADDAVTTYTFDLGAGTANATGGMAAFSGVDPLIPFDAPLGTLNVSQGIKSNAATAASITTSTSGAALLMLTQASDNMSWKDTIGTSGCWQVNGPAYLNEFLDLPYKVNSANFSVGAAWGIKSDPGQTGAGEVSFVDPLAARDFGAILIALKPLDAALVPPAVTSNLTLNNVYGAGNTYQISASNYPTSYAASGISSGVTIDASTGAIAFAKTIPVGVHSLTISASNAVGTGSATLIYTVTPFPLTITASNSIKCQGVNLTLGTASFTVNTTLPNSELVSSVLLSSSGATADATAGTYPLIPSDATGTLGFSAANYNITYSAGTLTVKPLNAWTGAVNGSWNQTGNWCLAGTEVPGATSAVEIWPEGATLEIDASVAAGSMLIREGASVIMRTGGNLQLHGNWINQGGFQAETGTAVVLNAGNFTLGGSRPTTFRNLTLTGGGEKSITGIINVNGVLSLNSGYIVAPVTFPLTINNNGSVVGASNLSFVKGYVKKIGTNGASNYAFDFPIGQSDDMIYDPLRITFPIASTTDAFVVGHQHTPYPSVAKRLYIKTLASEYWDIIKSSLTHNSNGVSIRIHYHVTANSGGDETGYFPGALTLANYKLGHYNTDSSRWEVAVTGASVINRVEAGSDMTNGYLVVDNVQQFSPFAPIELEASALPVILKGFSARSVGAGQVKLQWETLQEQMNKGFWIERKSANQDKFERIGFVPSKVPGGSSYKQTGYQFTDNPIVSGKLLYRLVQEDLDSKLTVGEVKKVELNQGVIFSVYPNPSRGKVIIQLYDQSNDYALDVYDGMGNKISSFKKVPKTGCQIELPNSGIFIFRLTNLNSGEMHISRHIVQQ